MSIKIESIQPKIGLPGGEIRLLGKGFEPEESSNISVFFGDTNSRIDAVSKNMIMTTIPEDCTSSEVTVKKDSIASEPYYFKIPLPIITGLHLVDNPTIDSKDIIYATFSGGRGENTPISVFKVVNFKEKRIYLKGIVNATSLTIDNQDVLYVLSRFNGKLYRSYGENEYEVFSQGFGVGFGLAFNSKNELYVGDRTGSIFKVSKDGKAYFFSSLHQSYIAYHMSIDKDDNLYVTNPVHMGENYIYKFDKDGNKSIFHFGLSLFHAFTFDSNNNMYLAESKRRESRIIRITPDKKIDVILCGSNFIGCKFDSQNNLIVASSTSLYKINKEDLN